VEGPPHFVFAFVVVVLSPLQLLCLSVRLSGLTPVFAEVSPSWVLSYDQADLLDPGPAFQLLFAIDGGSDLSKELQIDQFVDLVA